MVIQYINANQLLSLQDFLADPLNSIRQGGVSPLVILNENKPAFYVLPPDGWELLYQGSESRSIPTPVQKQQPAPQAASLRQIGEPPSFEKLNRFSRLSDDLLEAEWERVARGELSAASVGIQRNRLEAHVLPFFRYIPPTQVTHVELSGFVSRLTQHQLSTTTISGYAEQGIQIYRAALNCTVFRAGRAPHRPFGPFAWP